MKNFDIKLFDYNIDIIMQKNQVIALKKILS